MLDMVLSHPIPCVSKNHKDKVCWLSALANGENKDTTQDDILICNECESFKEIINRGFGRRTADIALGTTVAKLLAQTTDGSVKRLQQSFSTLDQSATSFGNQVRALDGQVTSFRKQGDGCEECLLTTLRCRCRSQECNRSPFHKFAKTWTAS